MTSRTPDQVRAALARAEAICEAIVQETAFQPTVSASCAYCGYRQHCAAYADVLAGKAVPGRADAANVDDLSDEREQLVTVERLVEKRRKEIDRVLMKHLKQQPEIVTKHVRYSTFNTKSYEYPVEETLDELAQLTGWTREQVAARIVAVDNGALKDVIAEIGRTKGAAHAALVEANLQAIATISQSPRLWAKRLDR
jgi:hypothetical protein